MDLLPPPFVVCGVRSVPIQTSIEYVASLNSTSFYFRSQSCLVRQESCRWLRPTPLGGGDERASVVFLGVQGCKVRKRAPDIPVRPPSPTRSASHSLCLARHASDSSSSTLVATPSTPFPQQPSLPLSSCPESYGQRHADRPGLVSRRHKCSPP